MTKLAINGFGRIGRIFFRQVFSAQGGQGSASGWDIVAVNDLGSPENLAYLLRHDSVYRQYDKPVEVKNGNLVVDGKEVKVLSKKTPAELPWKELGVDIVIESTGVFDSQEESQGHLDAGAKRVIITAPAKDETTPTVTPGFDFQTLSAGGVSSNASCTTNAVNPVVAVMMNTVGIKKASLTTVHGYTATQGLVDGPDKKGDFRRARAGAQNIVPSTTGAAEATIRAIPALAGKFDGIAMRVPVISGSLIDFTFVAGRATSVQEVNEIFKKAAASAEWRGILTATEEPLVSSDILGNPHGSIVDLALTRVIDGDLVKVFSWYDNEWGYCAMLMKHVEEVAKLI